MIRDTPTGPACESCGRTLRNRSIYGTEANFSLNTHYCRYCYDKGELLEPEITMEQMIEKVADIMVFKSKVPRSVALKRATSLVPPLKRWQGK
jgi:hypothetical protein